MNACVGADEYEPCQGQTPARIGRGLRRYLSVGLIALVCSNSPLVQAAEATLYELANGDVFEGVMVDGLRHGEGSYVWANGARYEGSFLNDKMYGKGRYTFVDGRVYVGDFVNDERHGRGLLTFEGHEYEGEFKNGAMTGVGRIRYDNGDTYEGDFLAGSPHGAGKFVWSTNQRVYEGEFLRGQPHGRGAYTDPTGEAYEGAFRSGLKHGFGEHRLPSGNRYRGHFVNDRRHGLGEVLWIDGEVYRGDFAMDEYHGYVVFEGKDRDREIGRWVNGEPLWRKPIAAIEACQFSIDEAVWMFDGRECVNGLAHGPGFAVRLDGRAVIENARAILGQLVTGEIRELTPSP